ncbi:Glycosyltransferase involved in cell wall bisynthesis [Carnobacterium iners]|uniref:Glycosyltransferase involved in cell wall bisynthesis n=1 Tax=Carnobacterium iners TaxID=1073423 RepID=A0A1X7N413_9LACT|nr:glycosyltransferase family 4 protein [Carnobacterium iners]SEK61359.1 Glycosyltransferase involved in cell wall bisynthesis [Carnobacterium iners]SMH32111.1 Glycosyltransferase involved in cell wall bisynthesis [Carnobacterium iners]
MNKFTQLREDYFNENTLRSFPTLFLEKYKEEHYFDEKKEQILDHIKDSFALDTKKELVEKDLIGLLSYLGQDEYLDRYIVNSITKNCHMLTEEGFDREVRYYLAQKNPNDSTVFALVDSCIECNRNVLNKERITSLLINHSKQLDIFSILIDYLYHFKVDGYEAIIYEWLKEDYPINIKIQLIDLLIELYSLENLNYNAIEALSPFQKNKKLFSDYKTILNKEKVVKTNGLTILQSMFYGDFENSGKGNNGGIAVFLKTLGNELSESDQISLVVTLTITNEWLDNQSIMNYYSDNHLFIRAPIYIDTTDKDPFLKKERFIKRAVDRFLKKVGIEPDIFHVRYLDNASKAIALLSKERGKKFVFTLTPDPHRNMTNKDGALKVYPFNEYVQKINKIMIGDELISESDQIVGIGNYKVKKELELYFPQLVREDKKETIWMISEGIQADSAFESKSEKVNQPNELKQIEFKKGFFDKPIILNVGRLEQQKAQDELLKAWGNSSISEVYNLLVIGGDLENPSKDEKKMLHSFEEYFSDHSQLRDYFHHIGALSNENIRLIEKKIMQHQKQYPQIYLCSSKKEEFGIAILEALSQKFLVLGPERGGVKSYIESGTNGFLIDTTNWQTIFEETKMIIENLKNNPVVFEGIQSAGEKTVKERFSMEKIAKEFLSFYLSLKRSKVNEY